MNRRSLMTRMAAFAAAAPFLSTAMLEMAGAQDSAPQTGGRLIFSTNLEPECYDPHVSAADVTNKVARSIVDSLLAAAPDGSFQPWLAESFEVSEDARQFTFKLRSGIQFSDGTPFNADAVKFTFDRIVDPATQSQYAISLMGPYESTTVIDDLTVQVNFTQGFIPFLQSLTQPTLSPQSPTVLKSGAVCLPPVGTGPYMLKEVRPQESLILQRNPNYTSPSPLAANTGPAYLDELEYRWIPDDAVRTGSLTSGQIDMADTIPPKDVADLAGQGFTQYNAAAPGMPYVLLVNSSNAPWDDLVVRKAFRDSLDIDGIVEVLYFGQKERAWSAISPVTFGYDASLEGSWLQDIDGANAALDAAGWTLDGDFRSKDGVSLIARWPVPGGGNRDQRNEIGQLIKEQAKEVGIDVQIEQVGIGPYLEAIQQNQYDLGDFSFISGDPDVMRIMFKSDNAPTPERIAQNFSHVDNADVDAWADEAAQTVDADARAALYVQIQQWVSTNVAIVPIYLETEIMFSKPDVQGITVNPQAYPEFNDAWIAS